MYTSINRYNLKTIILYIKSMTLTIPTFGEVQYKI